MTDLNSELNKAREKSGGMSRDGGSSANTLRSLMSALPGGNDGEMERQMESVERIRAGPSQGGKRPEDMSPQELHAVLWQVLSFRDSGELRIPCETTLLLSNKYYSCEEDREDNR